MVWIVTEMNNVIIKSVMFNLPLKLLVQIVCAKPENANENERKKTMFILIIASFGW